MDPTVKQKNKRTLLYQVLLFVIFFALAFFGTKFLFKKDIGDQLKEVSTEMNKSLPMNVDAETRLDGTTFIAPKTMQYNYTALSTNADSLSLDREDLINQLQSNTQNLLDTSPAMKLFRENDVTLKYNYKDKNGKALIDFSINPTKK